jgi:hypothetical protein
MNNIYNRLLKMPIDLDPDLTSYLVEANCRASNESEVFEILVEVRKMLLIKE